MIIRKKQTVTKLWEGCCRTDQKVPYLHTSNYNKLLVIGKNVGLCLFMHCKELFLLVSVLLAQNLYFDS